MNRYPQKRKPKKTARILTAGLVLVALMLFAGVNWLATAVEQRYALSADLSFNALTMQSALTGDALSQLDRKVDLYMVTTGTGDTMGDSVLLRNDLKTILERYRSQSGRLTLQEVNLLSNPTWSTRFSDLLNGETLDGDCVVVVCEEMRRARALTADDFLRYQYDLDSQAFVVSAYAIEKSLTEAIVYVSSAETPIVQIMTGHGELSASETDVLEKHLTNAGYQVERVTLHESDDLDARYPLMVLCPQFDLTEQEAGWLNSYLDAGGGMIYIAGYTTPTGLPRWNAVMAAYGLSVRKGIVVATGSDQTSYYNDSPTALLPYMQATPETEALLREGQDILLMPGVRAIGLSEEREEDIYLESLLKSGDAYLRVYEDGVESLERQPGDETGYFDLAALARKYSEDRALGTVIVIGNDTMFTEAWIYENTYQDAFLRTLLHAAGTQDAVSLDIPVKSASRAGLGLGSLTGAVIAACLLPLLVVLLALCVLLPRRHL